MPRPPRVDFPGAWHHVFDRGRARQAIFVDDADRFIFFDCIAELKQGTRGRVGNPAKRFAVWALRERTLLSYAQIGRQMKMSESAVAKDLAKSRKQLELFERWSSEWLTRHEEKFEVVLPAKG
jgi:hypothetical protein